MANLWGTFGTGTINVVGGGTTTTTTTSAGTTSQDRINIGFGPRLNPSPTDTSGFTFTGQPISPAEYQSRKVDFTREFLDSSLVGLGQQTGIDPTTTPAVGEDITLSGAGDEKDDDSQSILSMGTAVSGETAFDAMKVGLENVTTSDYNKYSDYLAASGKADRVNMVRSIYEPLFGGDISDLDFGEFAKTAQEAPAKAGKATSEYLKDPSKLAKKGMASVFASVMPFPAGPAIGGIIGGQEVKNAFGNDSLRPSGIFGVVHDAVLSRQYQDMAMIKAATQAERMAQGEMEIAGASYVPADTGFALQFSGGFGVTRKPGGRGYIGNTMGLSYQQLKNMEAVYKGYLPQSYTFDPSQKKNFFGQNTNVRIEDSGGAMSGGASFYNANGTFYNGVTGQTSAVGLRSDMQKLGDTYGLTYDQAKKAVTDARNGKGTVMDNIRSIQADQQRAERAAAAKEKAAKEAAAAAAAAAKASQGTGGGAAGDAKEQSYDSGGYSTGSFAGSGGRETGGGGFTEGGTYSGLAAGGTVGMAAGGAMAAGSSGFIGAPPSQVPEEKTVADDQLTEYPEGTFIINAAAVEEAGESDIIKMLNDAEKEAVRRGIAIDKSGNSAKLIDVAVSQGEVKVAPYLAKIIGYDRLRKINNRGKPEVAERQREASSGGFI